LEVIHVLSAAMKITCPILSVVLPRKKKENPQQEHPGAGSSANLSTAGAKATAAQHPQTWGMTNPGRVGWR